MKRFSRILLSATLLVASLCGGNVLHAADAPVNIIFDTDVDHDCDDIGALYILHGAMERGEANLLATIGCTSTDGIAPALDAINTWFGRPGIPVGTLKDKDLLDHKGFAADILKHYPSKFPSGKDYLDAVAVYRETLAKQPDGSVVGRASSAPKTAHAPSGLLTRPTNMIDDIELAPSRRLPPNECSAHHETDRHRRQAVILPCALLCSLSSPRCSS